MFFSVLAGIIPLSLLNGGHLIPFAALSASGRATAPPPGSAAYGWFVTGDDLTGVLHDL